MYAIILNNIVKNVIVWDGSTPLHLLDGEIVVALTEREFCEPNASFQPNASSRFIRLESE